MDYQLILSQALVKYNNSSFIFTTSSKNATLIKVFVAEAYQKLTPRSLPRRRYFYFQSHRYRRRKRKGTFHHNLHPEKQGKNTDSATPLRSYENLFSP